MSTKTKTPATHLVEAIHMSYPEVEVGYCIAGYITGILGVVMSLWDNKEAAEKMLPSSAYHTAIVYNFATGEIVAAHLPPEPKGAAERKWLATVQMECVGFAGQHDEAGASFRLGSAVRMGGPAIDEFYELAIDPQTVYNLFAEELVARWNRGPVE